MKSYKVKELIAILMPWLTKKQVLIIRQFLLNFLLFAVPFISTNQIVTGIAINCFLFILANRSWKKEYFISIALPSLAALSRGFVWGSLTKNLLFFLPVIWVSNFLLVYNYRLMKKKFHSKLFAAMESAVLKGCFLIVTSGLIINEFNLPSTLIKLMGINQLITASVGALIFLALKMIPLKKFSAK